MSDLRLPPSLVSLQGVTSAPANADSPEKPMVSGLFEGDERDILAAELSRLREEHRDLDMAIGALEHVGPADQLQIQRLKKRKLVLKDRISFIEDQLTPDIIA
ncbi:conserved hypothetical protein [Chelatococcus asaccharovorans]|nr:conserved hypothetical protein [Chelatococcus asaccharovorans]CAH1685725.1 conserved hypothetical protein [Chelatococcus asaccharovorans]